MPALPGSTRSSKVRVTSPVTMSIASNGSIENEPRFSLHVAGLKIGAPDWA